MSAPSYDSHRESGVRHIGDLPTHWSLVALKRVATFTYGDALAADVRGEGDIKVFGSNGPVGTHSAPNTFAPVVFVGRKGSCGALTWSDTAGFAIDTVYYVDRSCCRAGLRWLYWTLHTLGLEHSSQDTGVPGLSREVAHGSSVPLPPPAEQAAIAAFLDRETGKIDALVEAQTRLIELLKEKRQAVISHAVTKGLDPAAPMKDSGVEWLGQVPAHWEVRPLRSFTKLITGLTPPSEDTSFYADDAEGHPWLRPEDIDEQGLPSTASRTLTDEGIALCRSVQARSSLVCCIGTIGKVGFVNEPVATNQQITAIQPSARHRFIYHALIAARAEMEASAVGNVLRLRTH